MKNLAVTPQSPIVKNLFRKKELLEQNDPAHKDIRPLLIVLGGGMRGVSGGGAVTALNLLGLNEVFDVAIGASAGAPIIAYFLAGTAQTYLGTSLFYDELRGHAFINPWRLKEIADVDWLGSTFAEGEKKLDVESVLRHRTEFFAAFTDYVDGYTQLFDVKNYPKQVVRMLEISSAIPVLYRKKLDFDGRQYLDGSVAFSVRRILEEHVLEKYKPTDILLVTNRDEDGVSKTEPIERLAMFFSHHFERLLLGRIRLFDDLECLATLPKQGISVGVLASPPTKKAVGNLTTDPSRLWELGNETLRHTLKSFGKPELYRPLLFPQKVVRTPGTNSKQD